MHDRGQLGRELEEVTATLRQRPAQLQRAAKLRGIEPERHSVSTSGDSASSSRERPQSRSPSSP
jgi:hypothetical protein